MSIVSIPHLSQSLMQALFPFSFFFPLAIVVYCTIAESVSDTFLLFQHSNLTQSKYFPLSLLKWSLTCLKYPPHYFKHPNKDKLSYFLFLLSFDTILYFVSWCDTSELCHFETNPSHLTHFTLCATVQIHQYISKFHDFTFSKCCAVFHCTYVQYSVICFSVLGLFPGFDYCEQCYK